MEDLLLLVLVVEELADRAIVPGKAKPAVLAVLLHLLHMLALKALDYLCREAVELMSLLDVPLI